VRGKKNPVATRKGGGRGGGATGRKTLKEVFQPSLAKIFNACERKRGSFAGKKRKTRIVKTVKRMGKSRQRGKILL